MVLTIYDLSGIQDYVFASNRLREMVGASSIINKGLFQNIPKLLNQKPDDWMEKDFSFSDGDEKQIVYIGGGNALMAFNCQDTSNEFTRDLQKLIFQQAGGALKLCTASIPAGSNDTLPNTQKDLMDRLEENKRVTPNVSAAKGFSINAYENITYEPLLVFGGVYASRSVFLKNMEYLDIKEGNIDYFNGIQIEGIRYTDDFDKFIKDNSKNYLAVIHIDGNTMGKRIREFTQGLENECLQEGLNALRMLSSEINRAYVHVLKETIKKLYGKRANECEEINFRPIIMDGDDVTVICSAEDAFPFVEDFMVNLRNISRNESYKIISGFRLTAAAGMAFVNAGFPFYTAYDIAEQCCKNAKKVTLVEREVVNKSSMDYHVCYSGVTTDIADYRSKYYTFESGKPAGIEDADISEKTGLSDKDPDIGKTTKYLLYNRPYIFSLENDRYGYEFGFKAVCDNLIDIKDGQAKLKIARSKLKGLRNDYGKGPLAARVYGDFLKSRHKGEKDEYVAALLSEPFSCDNGTYYAKFFDVLDVLDFIAPAEPEEVEPNVKDGDETAAN